MNDNKLFSKHTLVVTVQTNPVDSVVKRRGQLETRLFSSKVGFQGVVLPQTGQPKTATDNEGRSFPEFFQVGKFEFLTPFPTMPLKGAKTGNEWPESFPNHRINTFYNF